MKHQNCIFCHNRDHFARLLNLALYARYQSDYCPLHLRSCQMIHFQDQVCLEESKEYFDSFYTFPYLKAKQKQLIEYYRFHQDIPRLFHKHYTPVLENYHERQRELRYRRIKQSLGMPVQERSQHQHFSFKALVGLTDLHTSRELMAMISKLRFVEPIVPQPSPKFNAIATIIRRQKQQMQTETTQASNDLRKILGNSKSPKNAKPVKPSAPQSQQLTKNKCHTQSDIQKQTITKNKTASQLLTEASEEFYRRWSNLISHRELQFKQMKMKQLRSPMLSKKRSLK